MGHTYIALHYRIVSGSKGRTPAITADIRPGYLPATGVGATLRPRRRCLSNDRNQHHAHE